MSGMWSAVAVFCGGGIGCLTRWGLGALLNPIFPTIPLGTVAVNLLGCFFFGLVYALAEQNALSKEWRVILLAGFMGGFTTFSTFAFDTVQMARGGPLGPSLLHLFLQVGCGCLCVVLGLWLGGKS